MKGTKVERAPGVWRLRVFIGTDPATGKPRQVSRTFKGPRKQADTALASFVAEAVSGNASVAPSTTLSAYLDRWLDFIAPTRSPTTTRGYRSKVKRIRSKLGHVKLNKLTAQHLDCAYREWLSEGLDPSSVHHLHRVLSASLHQAVQWGLLQSSPTSRSNPPHKRPQPRQIPTPDVIQTLASAAERHDQPVLAAAIAVATTTGLRRGELSGLRWSDIDFDSGILYVRRTIKHDDGSGWVVGPLKSHQKRAIALDAFAAAALSEHRTQVEGWASDAGAVPDLVDGYVFTFDPSCAEPMKPDSLGQAFARLCTAEGVKGVTLHTLRHFSASVLVASGRDVRIVAGRLGHADANTTRRIYSHVIDGRDRDAAEFLGALMSDTTRAEPVPSTRR